MLFLQGVTSSQSPISGVPVAIVLGALLNNTIKLPPTLAPGLKVCTTTVLRAGIVCVGAKLSLTDVMDVGLSSLQVVVPCIASGLVCTALVCRGLGLSPRLGSLIACGTSICGVTAITALAPVIQATQREVAIAVANVVAFGLVGMLTYPYVAPYLFNTSEAIGMFLGTAIHDTSQVLGSALTYNQLYGDELALQVAAVTKLTRNLFLVAVIPGFAWHYAQQSGGPTISATGLGKFVPMFLVGFLAVTAVRSLGDYMLKTSGSAFGVFDSTTWKQMTSAVGNSASQQMLGTAMAALGLTTSVKVFEGVGPRPFIAGGVASAAVGITGFAMAKMLEGPSKRVMK
ncbi:hypothetical protein CYMTET_52146 [Cymbomonas tetramitiformis]|uniref:Sulfate exporter family transporter n=1 Tax=Cymbomonas tetramitiformis TaxID=36881 RepID=A0AAE0ER30_9CHLO|nr:hypothetical protein CYMTET_52146 [Cymbomonas tetramitiformis]